MKKIILLNVVMITSGFSCFSQSSSSYSKNILSVSTGAAVPVGEFAKTDAYSQTAGFAKTGLNLSVEYQYKFSKGIGACSKLTWQQHTLDQTDILIALKNSNPDETYTLDFQKWRLFGAFAGLYAALPVGSGRVIFKPRLMIGALHASSPGSQITGVYNLRKDWSNTASVSTTAVSYIVGWGVSVKASEIINLLINIDYISAKLKFDNETTITNYGVERYSLTQKFGSINFCVGIAFKLDPQTAAAKQ